MENLIVDNAKVMSKGQITLQNGMIGEAEKSGLTTEDNIDQIVKEVRGEMEEV